MLLSCGKGCVKVYGPIIIQSIKALEKKLHTSGQQVGLESIKNLIYEALLLSCGKGCMKVYGPIIIQSIKALEKKLHTSWQQERYGKY